jgi:quinoprotein glucose dehydrogenase
VPHAAYYGSIGRVEPVRGLPLWKPPYARITAIDLTTGSHRWMTQSADRSRIPTPCF